MDVREDFENDYFCKKLYHKCLAEFLIPLKDTTDYENALLLAETVS